MFPTPTQIDLAVAMKELDIQRETSKFDYLEYLPTESYGQTTRRMLGRVINAGKSILGKSNGQIRRLEEQSST